MLYEALEIEELLNFKDNDKLVIDLMDNNGAQLKLIGLKKHQIIDNHISHNNVCLYVLEGEIKLEFSSENVNKCETCGCSIDSDADNAGKKYKIKKGQFFFFEKNVMHSVEALKDSSFLLIKI